MIRLPIVLATIINFLFLSFIIFLALQDGKCGDLNLTRFKCFLQAPPNEIGDTLSGIFGSMTLIWVVASVFQQSMELRAQRAEFKIMAQAQTAQVKTLEAQAVIFRDEHKRSSEKHNAAKMNGEIRHILQAFTEHPPSLIVKFAEQQSGVINILDRDLTINMTTDGYRANDLELKYLVDRIFKIENIIAQDAEVKAAESDTEELLSKLLQTLVTLEGLRPEVSDVAGKRLSSMKISAGVISLRRLLERLVPLEN